MQKNITKQIDISKIKNGWVEFLLDSLVDCEYCGKMFGPYDHDIIGISGKNVLGCICGSCAEKLARPYLNSLKLSES